MVLKDINFLQSDLFPDSDASGDGLTADLNAQIVWNDVGIGIVPIGGVIGWFKTLAGTPPLLPNYLECDGSVIANGESPINGVTLPDLNGDNAFLRGAATSGATGGTESHDHSVPDAASNCGGGAVDVAAPTTTGTAGTLPTYHQVVWVMRIY